MRTSLAIAALAGLTLAGLAFTALICLATGALVAIAYFVLTPWLPPPEGLPGE
ncbi:MAG TPA: hypothetical protein VHO29_12620 [Marmoricola sp.]|nr:hypothetical protein [Marmoricola sp.]